MVADICMVLGIGIDVGKEIFTLKNGVIPIFLKIEFEFRDESVPP